jgi:hypothetical protein
MKSAWKTALLSAAAILATQAAASAKGAPPPAINAAPHNYKKQLYWKPNRSGYYNLVPADLHN